MALHSLQSGPPGLSQEPKSVPEPGLAWCKRRQPRSPGVSFSRRRGGECSFRRKPYCCGGCATPASGHHRALRGFIRQATVLLQSTPLAHSLVNWNRNSGAESSIETRESLQLSADEEAGSRYSRSESVSRNAVRTSPGERLLDVDAEAGGTISLRKRDGDTGNRAYPATIESGIEGPDSDARPSALKRRPAVTARPHLAHQPNSGGSEEPTEADTSTASDSRDPRDDDFEDARSTASEKIYAGVWNLGYHESEKPRAPFSYTRRVKHRTFRASVRSYFSLRPTRFSPVFSPPGSPA